MARAAKERWLPVVGFELAYAVSDRGRVKSLARKVRHPCGGDKYVGGRLLKPFVDRLGYPAVGVHQFGKRKVVKTFRLMLAAFVGPCPRDMTARHLDGDPTNNNLDNLCWGTWAEQGRDKIEHGTVPRGSSQWCAKLCDADVLEIRRLYAAGGVSQAVLGQRFGIGKSGIGRIIRRKKWTHI